MTKAVTPAQRWTVRFALDLAIHMERRGEYRLSDILAEHGFTTSDLLTFKKDRAFIDALTTLRKRIAEDGMLFRLKSKLLAETMLKTASEIITDSTMPAPVRLATMREVVAWAGLNESKSSGKADLDKPPVQVVINMGNQQITAGAAPTTLEGTSRVVDPPRADIDDGEGALASASTSMGITRELLPPVEIDTERDLEREVEGVLHNNPLVGGYEGVGGGSSSGIGGSVRPMSHPPLRERIDEEAGWLGGENIDSMIDDVVKGKPLW